ncbi:hypothetical protein ACP275_13G083900 [Erythranthe tilingii]
MEVPLDRCPRYRILRGKSRLSVEMFMLRHRLQSIITFDLERCVSQIWDERNRLKWVTSAIDRDVQKIHLNYFDDESLPSRRLFTCKTLVYLILVSCDVFPMGGAVCLPRLKKISLLSVELEADEALPHLLSGCPVLEELVMDFIHVFGFLYYIFTHDEKAHSQFWRE